jgi:hypothetical protein
MRAMRALSSYHPRAIAANLTAHTVRRSGDLIVHSSRRVRSMLQMVGVATYSLFTVLMLCSVCIAALFEAIARAFLPQRFEHLDRRLSTILDDVLEEKAE